MEEDTGTGFLSSREQALRNNLILEQICGFQPLSDLKTCRLLNRQWKIASQNGCVQKCGPIRFRRDPIFTPSPFIGVGLVQHQHPIEKVSQLIQVINTSGDAFPCKSFGVECGIVDTLNQESSVVNLFLAIAPIAETLSLDEISDKKLFKGDSPQNLKFPRLKFLKMWEDDGRGSPGAIASNLNFCRDIIQHSPKLASLELTFSYPETANVLIAILESGQGQNIGHLHLYGPLNNAHLIRLAKTGLKLHYLWLGFGRGSIVTEDEEGNSLTNFLSSQSSTLEVLHLRCQSFLKEELRISFPKMKKLTQLIAEMYLSSDSGITLSRISYSEQFPALQSLSIGQFSEGCLDSLFDFRIGPVDTVTTLELPERPDNPALMIWQAARIFPNVKKLIVPSRAVVTKAVYEAWQKVEELQIKMVSGGDSADQVLATNVRLGLGLSSRQLDQKNFQPVEFLHNLKVLRLKYAYGSITDRACRLVLLKLRSLRCLDLSESSEKRISKRVLTAMREKFAVLC